MNQLDSLEKRLHQIPNPPCDTKVLEEILYTASETGLLESGIRTPEVLLVVKLYLLAQSLGNVVPEELRM